MDDTLQHEISESQNTGVLLFSAKRTSESGQNLAVEGRFVRLLLFPRNAWMNLAIDHFLCFNPLVDIFVVSSMMTGSVGIYVVVTTS